MEIFTQHISIREINHLINLFILKKDCATPIATKTFNDVPDMVWLSFSVKEQPIRLIVHQNTNRFSFNGTLIKIENATHRTDTNETISELASSIADVLGGFIFSGEEVISQHDGKGEDPRFLIKLLNYKGVDDEEISLRLEALLNRKEVSND